MLQKTGLSFLATRLAEIYLLHFRITNLRDVDSRFSLVTSLANHKLTSKRSPLLQER